MMAKEISPEERLFNVIQKEKTSSSAGRKKITLNPQGLKRFFLGLILRPRTHLQGSDKESEPSVFLSVKLEHIDLKLINKTLGIILFGIIAALIYSALNKKVIPLKRLSIVSGSAFQEIGLKLAQDYQPLGSYIEEVKKRDLFHPASTAAGTFSKTSLSSMTKDLSLSGIYQGQHPEVIIEDKAAKKVYFLKQGDEIKGMKVKSILNDRVILQSGEEEIELL